MNSFILFDHQQKARAFVDALAPKYIPIPRTDSRYAGAKFVLTDNAVLSRMNKLQDLHRNGMNNFFIYPHAGRPSLVSAFYAQWPHITAEFAASKGHIEIMRRAGNKNKIHSVGWSLCPLQEFKPRDRVYNVLFAPIHPRNSAIDKKVNKTIFKKLYPLAMDGDIRLTVRYLSPLAGNGIDRCDGIEYIEGAAGPDFRQIDKADIVISHQTFAMLAVARGVPTVMMGEDIAPHVEYRNGQFLEARDWKDYRELVMYPYDLLYADDPMALMQRVAAGDDEITEWRNRMIGNPFDPLKFVEIVESYL